MPQNNTLMDAYNLVSIKNDVAFTAFDTDKLQALEKRVSRWIEEARTALER